MDATKSDYYSDAELLVIAAQDSRFQFKPLIGKQFGCLDHGLIEVIDYMGNDAAVIQAAQTSYGEGTKKVSTEGTLMNYLWRHQHTTPFEMCEIKVFMRLPIFVARQLIRHRTASVNEYSMRYSTPQDLFYTPETDHIQFQALDNKQGRSGEVDQRLQREFQDYTQGVAKSAMAGYNRFNDEKLARELNRINLPVSAYTQWYWKVDLKNLLHFLKLRMDSHAQYEIRVFANILGEIVKEWCPKVWAAFEEYTLHGMTLSRKEQKVVKAFMESFSLPEPEDSTLFETAGFTKREWDELKAKFKRLSES